MSGSDAGLIDSSSGLGRMIERRRFERYEVNVPFMIEWTDRGGSAPALHQTSNISARGAFLPSIESYVVGERVKVSFSLAFAGEESCPAGQSILITVMGRISRSGHNGTAVSFDDSFQISNSTEFGGVSTAVLQ